MIRAFTILNRVFLIFSLLALSLTLNCEKWSENSPEKALDALQEVFTKLLLHKERLKSLYPSSLLFRISTNVCLNMIRGQLKHQPGNMKDILANIALYDESEDRLIINDILERIFKKEKKSTREIAVMHFVDGMTLKEVAAEVGLSFSGVRKRIRGLQQRIKQTKET